MLVCKDSYQLYAVVYGLGKLCIRYVYIILMQ